MLQYGLVMSVCLFLFYNKVYKVFRKLLDKGRRSNPLQGATPNTYVTQSIDDSPEVCLHLGPLIIYSYKVKIDGRSRFKVTFSQVGASAILRDLCSLRNRRNKDNGG